MALKYDKVVPWGRTYEEYVNMFALSDEDLRKRILGCGDGPASFNSYITKNGGKAVSIDPIYQMKKEEIADRISETYEIVIEQTRNNIDKFNWTNIRSVDELGEIRMKAMKDFLLDFEGGKEEGRYIHAELPVLPFKDKEFDLSLSSHFLFLYTDNLTHEFHVQAIDEMLRVSTEVRIFPLLDVNSNKSKYLESIIDRYKSLGHIVEEVSVNYEFQKSGNKLLKIREIV